MYSELFKDTTVVLTVVFLVSYAKARYQDGLLRFERLLFGLTYGAAGLLMMTNPISPIEGVSFDGRTPFIGLAGVFGGWLGALIAGSFCLIYRIYLGGAGMVAGVLAIITAAIAGTVFHTMLKQRQSPPKGFELLLFGLLLGIFSTLWVYASVDKLRPHFLSIEGALFLVLFPFTAFVFGLFEVHEAKRRQRDRVLKENEIIFENAQRIGQIGVWLYWPEQDRFKLSSQVYRMIGVEANERPYLTGEEVAALTHPDDVDAIRAQFKKLADGQRAPGAFEFRVLRPDGSVRTISSYEIKSQEGLPFSDPRSRVFAGILQDTTDRNELFDQLAHTARLATIGELASGIGHEINNPLTASILFTDRIERKLLRSDQPPDNEILELLGRLSQRLQGISSLIRSMTSFARLEPRHKKPIDAHGVIIDTVAIFSELIPEGRLDIEIDLLATRHEIHGDAARLQQVLMNLLANAKDATEGAQKPRVRLQTRDAGPEFEISIEDNGAGMPPEVQKKVFTPFFTTKEKGHGTGLGLSIASSIVNDMSGTIEVSSAPHVGTEFRLRFPTLVRRISPGAELDF